MQQPVPVSVANTQDQSLLDELLAIQAEAIGWLPLAGAEGGGAYLHIGNLEQEEEVITVVGIPDLSMAAMNVLLLT